MAFIGLAGTGHSCRRTPDRWASSAALNPDEAVLRAAHLPWASSTTSRRAWVTSCKRSTTLSTTLRAAGLGNGAAFYGKRKSASYGEDDAMRKEDPNIANDEEDSAARRAALASTT